MTQADNDYKYTESHQGEGKGESYDAHYLSDPWDRFLWAREQQVMDIILKKYFKGVEINLLDFACGTGRVTSFLEHYANQSTGVDVSETMLAEAQKKLSKTSFFKADITNESALAGRKFNLITAFRFFLNAEPSLRANVIKSLVPHLEDDGYLIFNNHHCLNSPWIKLYNWRHLKKDPTGFYKVMTIGEMNELVDLQKFVYRIS
jgi:SAM-dependent methyltransferase